MERREELHRHGCSIAKQTILTTHPSGLQTRVSVELANFDALCVHSECKTPKRQPEWRENSPFLGRRGVFGGISAHGTPVLGRRSDAVNEGRLSQQCTPVMRRREVESPGGSPLMARRADEEEGSEVDNSVISGWLKFRDSKRVSLFCFCFFKDLLILVRKLWIWVNFTNLFYYITFINVCFLSYCSLYEFVCEITILFIIIEKPCKNYNKQFLVHESLLDVYHDHFLLFNAKYLNHTNILNKIVQEWVKRIWSRK